MMLFTARKEAQKLLDCMKALDSVFVNYQIKILEKLLESINKFRDKLDPCKGYKLKKKPL